MNYRSSQGGPPQGLEISYTTGHVTWDPDHVIPGDYSVQVVVEDIFTGITVSWSSYAIEYVRVLYGFYGYQQEKGQFRGFCG